MADEQYYGAAHPGQASQQSPGQAPGQMPAQHEQHERQEQWASVEPAPTAATGAYGVPVPTTPSAGYGAPAAPDAYSMPGAPAAYGAPTAGPVAYGAPTPAAYGAPTAPVSYGVPTAPGAYGAPAPTAAFDAYGNPGTPFGAYGAPTPTAYGTAAPGAYGAPVAPAVNAAAPAKSGSKKKFLAIGGAVLAALLIIAGVLVYFLVIQPAQHSQTTQNPPASTPIVAPPTNTTEPPAVTPPTTGQAPSAYSLTQKETFGRVVFLVDPAWRKIEMTNISTTYYYPSNTSFFMFQDISAGQEAYAGAPKSFIDDYCRGIESAGSPVVSRKEVTVANHEAIRLETTIELNGTVFDAFIYLVLLDDKTYAEIGFVWLQGEFSAYEPLLKDFLEKVTFS